MRAVAVALGIANSARVEDVSEPPAANGAVLARNRDRRMRHRPRYRLRPLWLATAQ
jgi:hypothetical protein